MTKRAATEKTKSCAGHFVFCTENVQHSAFGMLCLRYGYAKIILQEFMTKEAFYL